MDLPRLGLTLPCEFVSIRDGDTVVVSILDGRLRPAVRLIDCWCEELTTANGRAAKHYAEATLEAAKELYLHLPEPKHLTSLLANLTFDRLPGWIFLGPHVTLNEQMVTAGHATREKAKA